MSFVDTRRDKERAEDDEDSLFGSPPPSPGRPASPALALPSSGYSGSSTSTAPTQNVGTIALPGSHPDSELPINPLALSLNHGIVHRPPALPHQMQYPHLRPAMHSRVPVASASLVRSGASAAQLHAARNAAASSSALPKKSKKRTRHNEPPPKPVGPEFTLPDPTVPPPTHFLRNQENLLGRAGRVGGVKSANITHVRGSTPSNPILVEDEDKDEDEDEDETPILGRRVQTSDKTQPYIDPALLTAPTNQEIVSVLIGQKNIFPILEGVLKLVVGNTPITRPKTGFERNTTPTSQEQSTGSYPVKKRKLNRVPAGAADWDVPYPFPQGEGPEAYHKTWERERGKQLITQLIKLIKSAARKAATKKYLAQQRAKEGPTAAINARPPVPRGRRLAKNGSQAAGDATSEGQSRQPSCEVLHDTSNTPSTSRTPFPPSTLTPALTQIPSSQTHSQAQAQLPSEIDPSMAAAFDQLMSSLNDIPDQGHGHSHTTPPHGSDAGGMSINPNFLAAQNANAKANMEGDFSGSTGTPSTPTSTAGVDQPLFDTWMSFLESFPMNFDGTVNAHYADPSIASGTATAKSTSASTSALSSLTPSQCSTPGPLSDDFDFANMIGTEMAVAGSGALLTPTIDFDALLSSMFHQEQQALPQPQLNAGFDMQLDPNFINAPTFDDRLIDPDLLALSMQQSQAAMSTMDANAMNININVDMNMNVDLGHQAISPVASGSSSLGGSTNPSTPASAGWELSMPDIFTGGNGGVESGMEGQGWNNGGSGSGAGGGEELIMDFGVFPEMEDVQAVGGGYVADPKGKGKEREVSLPAPMPMPMTSTSATTIPSSTTTLTYPGAPTATRGKETFVPKPFSRQLRRDDIIKRAQEQKRLLQEELIAVKTRLWETTIEQAGLVTLQKKLGTVSAVSSGQAGDGVVS